MTYTDSFYQQYDKYLDEPAVSRNHSTVIDLFSLLAPRLQQVIDLGCGLCEYPMRAGGRVIAYCGIDTKSPHSNLQIDYTEQLNLSYPNKYVSAASFYPNVFVSLFSLEACYPAKKRYEVYNRYFEKLPIEAALVSGFYYEGSKEEKVEEAGSITSYQTLEPIEDFKSELFDEMRITMRTPSKMFGNDVVEVWKILTTKKRYR